MKKILIIFLLISFGAQAQTFKRDVTPGQYISDENRQTVLDFINARRAWAGVDSVKMGPSNEAMYNDVWSKWLDSKNTLIHKGGCEILSGGGMVPHSSLSSVMNFLDSKPHMAIMLDKHNAYAEIGGYTNAEGNVTLTITFGGVDTTYGPLSKHQRKVIKKIQKGKLTTYLFYKMRRSLY